MPSNDLELENTHQRKIIAERKNTKIRKKEMKTLSIKVNSYSNTRRHVQFWSKAEPYSTLTINIPEANIEQDEFIMNASHELYCAKVNAYLVQNNIIRKTDRKVKSGYQTYSVWKFMQDINEVASSNITLEDTIL